MFTILVISNDKKIVPILRPFEQLVSGRFVFSDDFDAGLKEVFEKRPTLGYIQEDISGVSGETVAKHIKSLLQSGAPRLILSATGPRPRRDDTLFDSVLNLSLPEMETREAVKAQLEKLGPQIWKDQAIPLAAESTPPLAAEMVQTATDELVQLLKPSSAPAVEEPENVTQEPHAAVSMAAANRVADAGPVSAAAPSWERVVEEDAHDAPPLRPRHVQEDDSEWLKELHSRRVDPVPLAVHTGSYRSRGKQVALAVTAVIIVVIATAILYLTAFTDSLRGILPQRQPAQPAAATRTASAIPSFVPVQGRDSGYRVANPGWDRYVDDSREYLLFSENQTLRVVQIIALKDDAISETLVASAAKEFAGVAVTLTDRSEKEGYLVEKGGAGAAEILVYRKKATGRVRAVVLSRT